MSACPTDDATPLPDELGGSGTDEAGSGSGSSSGSGSGSSSDSGTDSGSGSGDGCGNAVIDPGEACDNGPENADDAECTSTCALAQCGDGLVLAGVEACDDQNADNSDDCLDTCEAASCGDGFVWTGNEACDTGMLGSRDPKPGECDETCTIRTCVWDVDSLGFPITVYPGEIYLGQISFDGDCDLIVGEGEGSGRIYRVAQADASVELIATLPNPFTPAMTYRASDDRIYIGTGNDGSSELVAIDANDQLSSILGDPTRYASLAVAPEGFGDFGGQLLILDFFAQSLRAYDVENDSMTEIADFGGSQPSTMAFDPHGTLYVTEYDLDRISTVTAEGVITPFYEGLAQPEGLAASPDGASLFVAYRPGPGQMGQIGQLSIPDAVLTPGVPFEISGGFAPTGMVVDGDNHVLYQTFDGVNVTIESFDAAP